MKQIFILITALILGAITCNAQFVRGFVKDVNAATTSTKVLKYKTPIVAGIVSSATQLNTRNRQLQAQNTILSHACLLPKRVSTPAAAIKVEPVKVIFPQTPVLVRDSMNSFRHVPAELSIDTVCVQVQDSVAIGSIQ